jgi:hypothetical protein
MATLSIEQQYIARIMGLLEPLKARQIVRELARKRTVLTLQAVTPAIHVVFGPEDDVGESNQGAYTLRKPMTLKLVVSAEKDLDDKTDALKAEVQRVVEADRQLGGMVIDIAYKGDQPFTEDVTSPIGGTLLFYSIDYRRQRAKPESS